MNAAAFLAELREQGVEVSVERGDLLVVAPRGVLTPQICAALSEAKPELLAALRASAAGPFSPLVEYAASVFPKIKMTIRETGDTKRDFDLVGRVRCAIQEFQPGGNHIYLNIVTLDRRRVVVEWRALAARELRVALAHILARASEPHDRAI
jgi:TubC N-terminal docking domain